MLRGAAPAPGTRPAERAPRGTDRQQQAAPEGLRETCSRAEGPQRPRGPVSHEDGAYASLALTAVRRPPSQRPGVRDKAPTARVVTLRIADFLSAHSDAHRLCAVTASGRRHACARGPAVRERAERVDPSSELGRARETVAADQQPQGHEARCWSRPRPAKSGSSSCQPCGGAGGIRRERVKGASSADGPQKFCRSQRALTDSLCQPQGARSLGGEQRGTDERRRRRSCTPVRPLSCARSWHRPVPCDPQPHAVVPASAV